jgi:transcriptional regulator with AAA-type ATPase domain
MTIKSAQLTDRSEQALGLSDLPLPLGGSEAMRRVRDQIRRLASTDTPTLIYGETGTGKELVAAALHRLRAYPNRLTRRLCYRLPMP